MPVVLETSPEALVSLSEAEIGCDFQIRSVSGPGCEQLRNLGFCESLRVRKLSEGRNLLCAVCGSRIAVSSELAEQVKVAPIPRLS